MSADAKRVMHACEAASLGTLMDGAPYVSLVLAAFDGDGAPLLLLSDLSQHAANLKADRNVSLLFDGTTTLDERLTGPRLTVLGTATLHDDPAALARYVEQQPSAAFYAGFTDFHLYRVEIARGHFVAGFGKIAWIEAERLLGPRLTVQARAMRALIPVLLAALAFPAIAQAPKPLTPGAILARAPASDWQTIDPEDLLVLDLYKGGRIVIQLAPTFAPVHATNIRTLAKTHWYDGLFIERVQDDYVTQWGDPSGKKALPKGVTQHPPAEYERSVDGLKFSALPYKDTYADQAGFSGPWPTASSGGKAWLTHCYGMVGVGRDLNPDTGSGSELYAVIGHAPRALDRNITVVGRVLDGMPILASFPRGEGELGVYTKPAQFISIKRVRLASELTGADKPYFEVLKTDSATYKAWSDLRANRKDDFFLKPAGAVDVCSVLPPLRVGRRK